jgi:4-amino-4-deoxy-L-arabinose transferase-like glycosyltransferase
VIAVAAIAFAVRFGGMLLSQKWMPVVAADTSFYMDIARNLAAGNGYRTTLSEYEASRVPPLFPLSLAFLMKLTGMEIPLLIIGIANAIFRTIAVVALYLVAQRYFGAAAALAASALYVFDPWEALWVGYVIKESLAVCIFMLAILALAHAEGRRSPRSFAIAGAMIGLATLTRWAHGALLFAGLVLIFFPRRQERSARDRVADAIAMSLSMLVVLSPWLVRNWRVTGQPVLSPHFVGQKLYTSNGPGIAPVTDGYYAPRVPRQKTSGPPLNRDVSLGWLTIQHLLANPGELPKRTALKVVNMWQPTFATHSRRNLLFLGIPYVVLMLISIAGVVLAMRNRVRAPAIGVTLVVMLLVHLVFRGEIRNRQYLMPLFYAFGGYAVAAARPASAIRTSLASRSETASG